MDNCGLSGLYAFGASEVAIADMRRFVGGTRSDARRWRASGAGLRTDGRRRWSGDSSPPGLCRLRDCSCWVTTRVWLSRRNANMGVNEGRWELIRGDDSANVDNVVYFGCPGLTSFCRGRLGSLTKRPVWRALGAVSAG